MKNIALLYGIIGFLAGALIAILVSTNAVNNNMTGMMRMMGMRVGESEQMMREEEEIDGMGMSMREMMTGLEGKTGDEFDRSFLEEMIIHHQGAIEMAKQANERAKHTEIKNLAGDIISAQTREIEMMRQWQVDWSYRND